MKKIILASVIILCGLSACNSNTDDGIASVPKTDIAVKDLLENKSQQDFLQAMDRISNDVGVHTRAVTAKNATDFGRWGLLAIADGCGGLIGSGFLSWLTSAATSSAYGLYLDKTIAKMSERRMEVEIPEKKSLLAEHIDIAEWAGAKEIMNDSAAYEMMNEDVAFLFSDNQPQVSEDSIGFVHNQILEQVYKNNSISNSASLTRAAYDIERGGKTMSNFDDVWAANNKAAKELGYESREINEQKDKYDFYCKNIIPLIGKMNERVSQGNSNLNDIFQEMSIALNEYNIDAKFVAALSQSIVKAYLTNVDRNNIKEFSEKINASLKNSNLSEKDKILAKKLLQTATSSYVFWSSLKQQ